MSARYIVLSVALGFALVAWVGCYWALVIAARKLVSFVRGAPTRVRSTPLDLRSVWVIDRDLPDDASA